MRSPPKGIPSWLVASQTENAILWVQPTDEMPEGPTAPFHEEFRWPAVTYCPPWTQFHADPFQLVCVELSTLWQGLLENIMKLKEPISLFRGGF